MFKRFEHLFRFVAAAALLGWSAPALAGGPFEPPDGVGNPNGADYSGFQIVAFFQGVRDNANVETHFYCFHAGGAVADETVVQFYTIEGSASRNPIGVDPGSANIEPGEAWFEETAQGVFGSVGNLALARIITRDSVRKRNPSYVCQAHIVDRGTGNPIADLQPIQIAKKKKRK